MEKRPASGSVARLVGSLPAGAFRDAAVMWARPFGDDLIAAWDSCPRGSWLHVLANKCGVADTLTIAAAAHCVRATLATVLGPRGPAPGAIGGAADVAGKIAPLLDNIEDWCSSRAGDDDCAKAVTRAVELARHYNLLAHRATADDKARLSWFSLLFAATARTAEGLPFANEFGKRISIWPSSVHMCISAAETAFTLHTPTASIQARADFGQSVDFGLAAVIRAGIPPQAIAACTPLPLPPPKPASPKPCYIELRILPASRWQALASLWNQLASASDSKSGLDPEDDRWRNIARRTGVSATRLVHIITSIADCDYDLGKARRIHDSVGRIEFYPWIHPYGGIAPLEWLADLYSLDVIASDDGTGHRPRIH